MTKKKSHNFHMKLQALQSKSIRFLVLVFLKVYTKNA